MEDKLREMFDIAGKRILITGATGYLGRHMARGFLEVGAEVVLLGRSDKLRAQVREYGDEFGEQAVHGFQVDFYDREKLTDVLVKVAKEHDVDVLVNNACDLSERTGFNTPEGRLEKSTHDQWQAAFESGIYWAVRTTQIIGKQFVARGRGSIINISSMYGAVAPDPGLYEGTSFLNPPGYGVAKAGLIALSRYVASFWGRHGVRCNAVLPGPFPNVESRGPNSVDADDAFLQKVKSKTLLNRVGRPGELMGILIYLACEASSYMTGQTLVVDGGWTVT